MMHNTNQIAKACAIGEKINAADYPVGHAKRRRLLRRILRMYAAYWRTALDPKTARCYSRSARKF